MELLNQLFQSMASFLAWAPGGDTNYTLDDLRGAGLQTQKQVEALIGADTLSVIVHGHDESLLVPLRTAVANRTLANNAIFSAYSQRKAGTDIYKYEVEGMRRAYMENYYAAMDTLLSRLWSFSDSEASVPFMKSHYAQLAAGCRIRTAEEMDYLYPIDLSYLFFFRTLPLQTEVLSGRLGAYYSRIDGHDDQAAITADLDRALVKKTIAKALRRFDILEFPPTMRNLFDESHANRSGKDEADRALRLADLLDQEADALIADIDQLIESQSAPDLSSMSAHNRPDDKIIMMP